MELEARLLCVAVVELHTEAGIDKLLFHFFATGEGQILLFVILIDGHDDHLDRGNLRRQHQAVVVGVRHDQGTHQTGGDAP